MTQRQRNFLAVIKLFLDTIECTHNLQGVHQLKRRGGEGMKPSFLVCRRTEAKNLTLKL